jgi:hypothetical protein
MNIERFKALVEAYGANPVRWPEAERDAAIAFATITPDAQRALDEAAALDRLLDAAGTVPATRALEERVLATYGKRGSFAHCIRIAGESPTQWVPGAAIACSLLLGLLVGAALPGIAGVGEGSQVDPALIALAGDESDFWNELGDGS